MPKRFSLEQLMDNPEMQMSVDDMIGTSEDEGFEGMDFDQVTMEAFIGDAAEEYNTLARSFDSLIAVEEMRQRLLAKDTISTEEFVMFKQSLALINAGTGASQNIISVAVEAHTDPRVALEGIGETIVNTLATLGSDLLHSFKGLFKRLSYLFGVFESGFSDLGNLKSQLSKMEGEVTIQLPASRYFAYKEGQTVGDVREYIQQLSVAADALQQTLDAFNKFAEQSRFSTIKILLSFLPVGFDVSGWFRKNFGFINNFIESIKTIKGFRPAEKKSSIGKNADGFETDNYLGMFHLFYSVDQRLVKSPDEMDRSDLGKAVLNFNFLVQIDPFKGKETIEMKISKKDADDLFNEISKIRAGFIKRRSLINRLFAAANAMQAASSGSLLLNPATIPGPVIASMVGYRYRAILRTANLLFKNTGEIYSVAKGNINGVRKVLGAAVAANKAAPESKPE